MNLEKIKTYWIKNDELDIVSKVGLFIAMISIIISFFLVPLGLFAFELISWFDPQSDFAFGKKWSATLLYTIFPAWIMLYAVACRFFSLYLIIGTLAFSIPVSLYYNELIIQPYAVLVKWLDLTVLNETTSIVIICVGYLFAIYSAAFLRKNGVKFI